MWRSLALLLLASVATAPSAAAHFCPDDRRGFIAHYTGEIEDGDFRIGYTSGFARDDQGLAILRRCLANLHTTAWVRFRWNGPRPDPIFQGRIPRARASGPSSRVEEWQSSTSPDPDDAARDLELSIATSGDYDEDYSVDTYFKRASAPVPRVHLTQQQVGLRLDSTKDFIESMRALMEGIDRDRFRLSSGVLFAMQPDPETWESFITGVDEQQDQPLARVNVVVAVEYDPETLEITLETAIGFDQSVFEDGWKDALFEGMSIGIQGLEGLGYENVDLVKFSSLEEAEPLGLSFRGARQSSLIGSMQDFVDDERAPVVGDIPITVRLREDIIYQFHLEVIAPPASI